MWLSMSTCVNYFLLKPKSISSKVNLLHQLQLKNKKKTYIKNNYVCADMY